MSRGARAEGWLAPALTAVVALASGVGLVAQQATVLVHQCVSAGTVGRIGLTLALLRTDAACPAGTVGVDDGRRVVGVVVAVALPVLLAHVAAALVGVGAVAWLHRALRGVLAAVRVLPRGAAEPALPVVAPRLPVEVPVHLPGARLLAGARWRRGPPQVGLA